MKAAAILLALSLVANAALLVVSMSRRSATSSDSDTGGVVAAGSHATPPGGSPSTRANGSAAASPGGRVAATGAPAADSWHAFHGGDLKGLADRLRAAGFPLNTIRAIISGEVQARFSARQKALTQTVAEQPYWLQNQPTYNAEQRRAMRELSDERTRLLREVLGSDAQNQSPDYQAIMAAQYGPLPMEKIEQIQKLRSDYSELQQEVYEANNGLVMLPEDRAKLALLEKELQADLKKMLTPEEWAEYEIRSSQTSSSLRSRLATFKPTEEEFRAIFKIQKAMDDELGGANPTTSEEAQARQAKQKEVEAQMLALFPPERALQLKLAIDPAYNQVNRIVARFNLPAQAALDVVALQQQTQQRMTEIRSNRALPAPERDAQLAQLQAATQDRISAVLGERGTNAYLEYGGQWIQRIVPPPRVAPAPAPVRTN